MKCNAKPIIFGFVTFW